MPCEVPVLDKGDAFSLEYVVVGCLWTQKSTTLAHIATSTLHGG